MSKVDLAGDIRDAREVLEPKVKELLGLLQMWHMFHSAKVVAKEFHQSYDRLSHPLKIACTRSLVVDYQKPWSGNYSKEINSLKVPATKKKWSYPFLDEIVRTAEHEALVELRNHVIAHLGDSYEGGGITCKGIRVLNYSKNRPQDPGTLDEIFVPTIPVLSGIRGLLWLSDRTHIGKLYAHIEKAETLVGKEIRNRANSFRLTCMDHLHVIGHLSDLFSIVDTPIVGGNVNVASQADDPKPLTSTTPRELKIGEQNVQSLATVYEPQGEYPINVDIKGKGYRLKIDDMSENGKLNFNVSFPKYPFPKGQ